MSCQFVVGQRVVCISSGIWNRIDVADHLICRDGPKRGDIVRISKIWPTSLSYNGIALCGLYFSEWPGDEAYVHINFRALNERPKKTSIEVFKKLLTSKRITEDA